MLQCISWYIQYRTDFSWFYNKSYLVCAAGLLGNHKHSVLTCNLSVARWGMPRSLRTHLGHPLRYLFRIHRYYLSYMIWLMRSSLIGGRWGIEHSPAKRSSVRRVQVGLFLAFVCLYVGRILSDHDVFTHWWDEVLSMHSPALVWDKFNLVFSLPVFVCLFVSALWRGLWVMMSLMRSSLINARWGIEHSHARMSSVRRVQVGLFLAFICLLVHCLWGGLWVMYLMRSSLIDGRWGIEHSPARRSSVRQVQVGLFLAFVCLLVCWGGLWVMMSLMKSSLID